MRLGLALIAVLLAGCAQSEPAATPPPHAEGPSGFAHQVTASGCNGLTLILVVDSQEVQSVVPPGFHPRDANGILEDFLGQTPPGTGRTAVFLASILCDTITNATAGIGQGFMAVFVKPPNVPEVADDPVHYDLYEVVRFTDDPRLGYLAAAGWDVESAAVSLDVAYGPAQQALVGESAAAGEFPAYSMSALAPTTVPDESPVSFNDWSLRVWRAVDEGLGFHEYRFSHDVQVGTGACSLDDARLQEAVGRDQCPPLSRPESGDMTLAGLFPGLAYEGRIVHMPDAHAR